MRNLLKFWRDRKGASALEFAMILPVFCMMLFGSIQMGIAYYYAGTVQYALERTARVTMIDQDMSAGEVQTAFNAELAKFTDQTVTVSYVVDSSGDVPIAQLNANYPYEVIIPFIPTFTIVFAAETHIPLLPT